MKLRAGDDWEVYIKKYADYQSLDFPLLINAKLKRKNEEYRQYYEEWGWKPGVPHSVVLFGRSNSNNIIVGDPAVGIETWTEEALQVLWNGDGIYLQKKNQ